MADPKPPALSFPHPPTGRKVKTSHLFFIVALLSLLVVFSWNLVVDQQPQLRRLPDLFESSLEDYVDKLLLGGGEDEIDERLREELRDVDLAQVRLLDFINGEAPLVGSNIQVFGGSLRNISEFDVVSHFRVVWTQSLTLTKEPEYHPRDYLDIGRRARTVYILLRCWVDAFQGRDRPRSNALNNSPELKPLLSEPGVNVLLKNRVVELTANLFPWMKTSFPDVTEMLHSYFRTDVEPVGIATTGGTKHFYLIQHLILTLRKEFHLSIPVYVYYAGPSDMKRSMVDALNEMENVHAADLYTIFPSGTMHHQGWSAKAFAMVAAPVQTVLFIDADVLFFRSPLEVLEDEGFRKTNGLFFHDRKKREDWFMKGVHLFHRMNRYPSRYAYTLGYVRARTDPTGETHAMDSGFIPVSKSDPGSLFALLLAAQMNTQASADTLYEATYGDKESFWFARETLRVPYVFNAGYGGALGVPWSELGISKDGGAAPVGAEDDGTAPVSPNGVNSVCGISILQMNAHGQAFWWNGGSVVQDRHVVPAKDEELVYRNLTWMGFDPDGIETVWGDHYCLEKPGPKYFRNTSADENAVLERYRSIFRNEMRVVAGDGER